MLRKLLQKKGESIFLRTWLVQWIGWSLRRLLEDFGISLSGKSIRFFILQISNHDILWTFILNLTRTFFVGCHCWGGRCKSFSWSYIQMVYWWWRSVGMCLCIGHMHTHSFWKCKLWSLKFMLPSLFFVFFGWSGTLGFFMTCLWKLILYCECVIYHPFGSQYPLLFNGVPSFLLSRHVTCSLEVLCFFRLIVLWSLCTSSFLFIIIFPFLAE